VSEYGIERGDVLLSLQLTLTREEEERISPSPPHANGGHRPAASPPAPRQATARVSNGGPAFRPNFPSLPAAPSKPLVMLDAATGAGTLDALRRDLRLAEAAREGRRGALVGIEVETLDQLRLVCGSGAGEQVLKGLVEVAPFALRAQDRVYRSGRERLVLLLEGKGDAAVEAARAGLEVAVGRFLADRGFPPVHLTARPLDPAALAR